MTIVDDKRLDGVNMGDVNGGIHGSIIAGHDVITNIVVVGQILDLARVEGLIPSVPDVSGFASINAAFEAVFKQRLGNDLAEATAITGKMIGDIFANQMPREPLAAIPSYRQLLRGIAPDIVGRLQHFHYWEAFCEPAHRVDVLGSKSYGTGTVIWLSSMGDLWNKHFKPDSKILFGIAELTSQSKLTSVFVVKYGHTIETACDLSKPALKDKDSYFGRMSTEEFHVFITGLVIDMIRLSSQVANDRQFWGKVISMLITHKSD